ncbi:PBSX family phage terminase large subunit [Brachybacterium kimchii]|uniref:PBSX family phage terminase large subunit n=1 Tax=Brachybacterium kimchii TaxID=2942909 RepID=A0ABY4N4I4_9MICO|nr:PBSX family phage terminase large subunit [Brachybacterium kimchii]UQN29472.1 PBSX family phage terminase large subunit [Brachybacterium kimchii]
MPGLSTAQRASILESTGAVNGWEGSIRSGKTIASLIRFSEYAMASPEGHLAILGWTLTTIQRNVLDPLVNLHPSIVRHTRGSNVAWIMGREVQLVGFSDKRSEAVIRGLTLAGAYVDEATLMPEQTFVQLLGRLSIPGATLFFTTNPDSQSHWLRRRYLNRLDALPDWRIFHFTMDDNPALSAEYVEAKKREFTGLWYRRFILGEWVSAEGAIYDSWDPAQHVIPWETLPRMRRLLAAGMDYGTTNPSSAVLLGLGEDDTLYLVDEWRHDPSVTGRRLTDAQISAQVRDWLHEPHLPDQPDLTPEWLILDPAAASLKVQMRLDGERRVMDGNNHVAYGIRTVASLLTLGALHISDRCTGVIEEAPSYAWDPKATEKGEDKPLKVADHSLDAMRYAITTTETVWRPWIDEWTRRSQDAAA